MQADRGVGARGAGVGQVPQPAPAQLLPLGELRQVHGRHHQVHEGGCCTVV